MNVSKNSDPNVGMRKLQYVVCLKSKCTDFPMYQLVASHLIDVYWRVVSDLGGSRALLLFVYGRVLSPRYVCDAGKYRTTARHQILCETKQICHRDICFFN